MHPTFTKKYSGFHFCLAALLFLTTNAFSQIFWTEDFGTGCNTGTAANGVTTTNGSWTVTQTGFNEVYANEWFISGHTNNSGVGNCGTDCSGGNNQTLHVGNIAIPTLGLAA